eukprot:CAMPEP_0179215672 /NCGR_PEP_ID=MMETSP0797-20121207/2979_1 /TAXON_ID=47934 /ORGANISM="Dinophysis acuminata, Strain DAEP01" /LENGTH=509 /DNA_ID=CAMNT_0020921797 /DNA_START=154 /DNA_END=1681 /DNA_ORIENTATION=-
MSRRNAVTATARSFSKAKCSLASARPAPGSGPGAPPLASANMRASAPARCSSASAAALGRGWDSAACMAHRGDEPGLGYRRRSGGALLLERQVGHVEVADGDLPLVPEVVEGEERFAEMVVGKLCDGLAARGPTRQVPLGWDAEGEVRAHAEVREGGPAPEGVLAEGGRLLAAGDHLQPLQVLRLREQRLAPRLGRCRRGVPEALRMPRVQLAQVHQHPAGIRVVAGEHHPTVRLGEERLGLVSAAAAAPRLDEHGAGLFVVEVRELPCHLHRGLVFGCLPPLSIGACFVTIARRSPTQAQRCPLVQREALLESLPLRPQGTPQVVADEVVLAQGVVAGAALQGIQLREEHRGDVVQLVDLLGRLRRAFRRLGGAHQALVPLLGPLHGLRRGAPSRGVAPLLPPAPELLLDELAYAVGRRHVPPQEVVHVIGGVAAQAVERVTHDLAQVPVERPALRLALLELHEREGPLRAAEPEHPPEQEGGAEPLHVVDRVRPRARAGRALPQEPL